VNTLDIARIEAAVQRSLTLLRETYTPAPDDGGGWYHRLGVPPPGATATAVALMAFDVAGEKAVHLSDCLKFLTARQILSADPAIDGGWATNTSMQQPVVEATGWVVQCLGRLNCGLTDGAPDLRRGYLWLINNQNHDGGWGSFLGMPSRTWLTCLAIQALVQVNPYHESLMKAVRWLIDSPRQVQHAWGKDPSSTPTVTHTAFVLRTLFGGGFGQGDDRVRKGYRWLAEHLDTNSLDEPETRVEEYRAQREHPDGSRLWRSPALIHYGLPIAASALVTVPTDIASDMRPKLVAALETILATQNADGYWPNIYDAGITLWGVWPCVQALSGASRIRLAGDGDLVSLLGDVVVVRNDRARQGALADALINVLPQRQRFNFKRSLRRYWAWCLLAMFVIVGAVGVHVKIIGLSELGFGLIFPIILLIIHLTYERMKD
jgi:hypothetical protein